MSILTVLDHTGDTALEWDAELDTPENAAAIEAAEKIVREAFTKRSVVMRVEPNGDTTKLTEFDRSAPEIVIIPQLVGG